ncbi:hypothetical protein pb186bvf_005414 [Paramecium bursaria]
MNIIKQSCINSFLKQNLMNMKCNIFSEAFLLLSFKDKSNINMQVNNQNSIQNQQKIQNHKIYSYISFNQLQFINSLSPFYWSPIFKTNQKQYQLVLFYIIILRNYVLSETILNDLQTKDLKFYENSTLFY